jgi:hypothetical protein
MNTTKKFNRYWTIIFKGLEPIIGLLNSQNVTFTSGGTEDFIKT